MDCEVDVDECLIMSAHGELICGNFGDCVNLPGGYRCDCREGSGLQVIIWSL